MSYVKRCWAEISIDNLLDNFNKIKKCTDSRILCVVKSNAYGHGDVAIARELEKAGTDMFAVAAMNEAIHLRKNGIKSDIMLLGGCLEDSIPYATEYNVTLSVYDYEFAKHISDYAMSVSKHIKVHIKLDTGMSRIGIDCTDDIGCDNAAVLIERILSLPGIIVEGVFTHFSVSDEADGSEVTKTQLDNLLSVKNKLLNNGINIKIWHCSNSGAIMNYPESYLDMVRAGILIYGLYSGFGATDEYKPVMSLKTVITQIHTVKKGCSVSYGGTYTARKDIVAATVSIGYGDGYPRSLSSKGYMIINGKKADILGRVCMDQTIIDVTDIDCKVGDTVTVMGSEGKVSVTADDIAEIDGTINYEIVCGLSLRVPRVYIKDNKSFEVTEYI